MTQPRIPTCQRPHRHSANAILLLATAALALAATAAPDSARADAEFAADIQLAQAEAERTVALDIPARPLDAALTALADQAGLRLLFEADDVPDRQAPELRGEYALRDALRRLLAGTGLDYRFSDANTVTLVHSDVLSLERIRVEAGGPDGYAPDWPRTRRLGGPVDEAPQGVTVIPESVLADQRPRDMNDAVLQDAATQPGDGYEANYRVRGFDAALATDGVAQGELPNNSNFNETADVARIEILKGPRSILFGSLNPGGTINRVRKKPVDGTHRSVEGTLGAGADDAERVATELDVNAPLDENGRVHGRVIAAARDEESFRDFIDNDRLLLSPSLRYRVDADTELVADAYYRRERGFLDRGIPVLANGDVPDIDFSTFLQEPDDSLENTSSGAGLEWTHAWSDSATFGGRLFYQRLEEERAPTTEFLGRAGESVFAPVTATEVERFRSEFDQDYEQVGVQADVLFDLEFGNTRHELRFGLDVSNEEEDSEALFDLGLPAVDILDPQFGQTGPEIIAEEAQDKKADNYGVFIQDRIYLLDGRLVVLAGVRRDRTERSFESETTGVITDSADIDFTQQATSPQLGALYRWRPGVAFFGSYSESFEGTTPSTRGELSQGGTPDPETGAQVELGSRLQLTDGLEATVSLFRIDKEDVVVTDPDDPTREIQIGEQRSEGVELGLAGSPAERLRLRASLVRLDTEVTEDTQGREGNELPDAPEWSASVTGAYRFAADGPLDGWRFTPTVIYRDERFADLANDTEVDDYVRVDAGMHYRRGDLSAAVIVRNVFDEEYIQSAGPNASVIPGAPVSLELRAGYRF